MIHILLWRPFKIAQLFNFQDSPYPLSIYIQSSSTPLTLDVQFQTKTRNLSSEISEISEIFFQDFLIQVFDFAFRHFPKIHRSVLCKITIDLFYFVAVSEVNLREKKIHRSMAYEYIIQLSLYNFIVLRKK